MKMQKYRSDPAKIDEEIRSNNRLSVPDGHAMKGDKSIIESEKVYTYLEHTDPRRHEENKSNRQVRKAIGS